MYIKCRKTLNGLIYHQLYLLFELFFSSSCDLDFSATLCNHLTRSYFKPSISVVKDLVYSPQMSTSYDVSLLTKVKEIILKRVSDYHGYDVLIVLSVFRNSNPVCEGQEIAC